jgi:hypothetical protein
MWADSKGSSPLTPTPSAVQDSFSIASVDLPQSDPATNSRIPISVHQNILGHVRMSSDMSQRLQMVCDIDTTSLCM